MKPDGERIQAVVDFAPLKELKHLQQFLGCTNWLRPHLPVGYVHAVKRCRALGWARACVCAAEASEYNRAAASHRLMRVGSNLDVL